MVPYELHVLGDVDPVIDTVKLGSANRGGQSAVLQVTLVWHWPLEASFGCDDLTITVESDASLRQQIAGHVETGRASASDPALEV